MQKFKGYQYWANKRSPTVLVIITVEVDAEDQQTAVLNSFPTAQEIRDKHIEGYCFLNCMAIEVPEFEEPVVLTKRY